MTYCGHRFMRGFLLALLVAVEYAGQGTASAQNSPPADTTALAYHLSTNAVARAAGHSPGDEMCALANWHYANYTNDNLAALTNAVWSTNFWLHGVRGLSATCIGCSNGMGGQGLVTMVSPRHYLFATHMHPEGYLMAFLGTDNVIYWRKTLARADVSVPFATPAPMDTSVGILNADLPPSVGFMPVAPANLSSCLPVGASYTIQGIGMNQDMRYFGQPMRFSNPPFVIWNSMATSPYGLSTNWNIALRAGDSSNPETLLIDNQLVLLSHNYGIQAGPNYSLLFTAINKTMHELSTHNRVHSDYQLTPFRVADWPVSK